MSSTARGRPVLLLGFNVAHRPHVLFLALPDSILVVPLRARGKMTASVHQDLSLALSSGDELDREEVSAKEEEHERDEDAKVTPHVCAVVSVGKVHAVCTTDDVSSDNGTLDGARAGRANSVGIRGNELKTGELSAIELVHHNGFESVCNGIEVSDPPEPGPHVTSWDGEASVRDESEHHDRRERHGLMSRFRGGAQRPEDHGHDPGAHERK